MTTQTIQEQIAALPKMAVCDCADCMEETYIARIALLVRALEELHVASYYANAPTEMENAEQVLAAVKP